MQIIKKQRWPSVTLWLINIAIAKVGPHFPVQLKSGPACPSYSHPPPLSPQLITPKRSPETITSNHMLYLQNHIRLQFHSCGYLGFRIGTRDHRREGKGYYLCRDNLALNEALPFKCSWTDWAIPMKLEGTENNEPKVGVRKTFVVQFSKRGVG